VWIPRRACCRDDSPIRRYVDADRDAVLKLHVEALGPTGAHLGRGPWDDDLEQIPSVYLQSDGEFLIGVVGDEIVAIGALRRITPVIAEIKRMRTAPSLQGRGFGRALLMRLERRAVELGYERLRLDTTNTQVAARHLYETAGYRETGRRAGLGADEDILYEKALDEP
jgi:ribosomal protein S18 acetylase RimI-like enzyme